MKTLLHILKAICEWAEKSQTDNAVMETNWLITKLNP